MASTARTRQTKAGRGTVLIVLAAVIAAVVGTVTLVTLAAPAGAVRVQPGTDSSVIWVHTAGGRDAANEPTPLAGVVLNLFPAENSATPIAGFGSCTSDADGDCSFVVPDTGVGGVNRDARYWVRQVAGPAGYTALSGYSIPSGRPSGGLASTAYQFQTGTQLRATQTYESGFEFMNNPGPNGYDTSTGIWPSVLPNPLAVTKCGIQLALGLDLSASPPAVEAIGDRIIQAIGNLDQPSTVSLFPFSGAAPGFGNHDSIQLSLDGTGDVTSAESALSATLEPGTESSWDSVFHHIATRPEHYDATVMITGLTPTLTVGAPGPTVNAASLEGAVLSANELKAEGTEIDMVTAFTPPNGDGDSHDLEAVSGPGRNQSWYLSDQNAGGDLGALVTKLAGDTNGPCHEPVTITDRVVPVGGTIADAIPADGFAFTTATTGSVSAFPPPRTVDDGHTTLPMTFENNIGGTATINQTARNGFALLPVGGANASCTREDTGAAVPVTNSGANGFTLTVTVPGAVDCSIYDQTLAQTEIQLSDTWVINGTTYAEGAQPAGFTAVPTLDGIAEPWNQDLRINSPRPVIDESVDLSARPGCTLAAVISTIDTSPFGNVAMPFRSPTLPFIANTVAITNTLTCTSTLKLVAAVANGPAQPSGWTLSATAGGATGPSGLSGVSAAVTPGVQYALAESDGDPRYVQTDQRTTPVAGSTGSWQCVSLAADASTVLPGFSDGINGGVTVPFGANVQCTATNTTALLTLGDTVTNTHGGTADAGDFTLKATPFGPIGSFPADLTPVSAAGDAGTVLFVRPGTSYRLTESGPSGYTSDGTWACTTGGGPAGVTTRIVPAPATSTSCITANTDEPGQLTLRKIVASGPAQPADWTLTATPIGIPSQATVSGNGANGVTDADVTAGTYRLSESGPAGYTAGAWDCTGGGVTGSDVVVGNGAAVSCTITNTALPAHLTLVDVVDNGSTGGTGQPADWTLSATGPTPLSGPGGDPSITAVTVAPGTYSLASSGGPTGYSTSNWACTGATATALAAVTIGAGDQVVCTVTDVAQAARFSLSNSVVPFTRAGPNAPRARETGALQPATQPPTAWLLTASGPVTISGHVGDLAITNAVVPVGAYVLSAVGPAGYTPSAWSCTGTTASGSTIVVGLGVTIACSVTEVEDFVPPTSPPPTSPPPPPTSPPPATVPSTTPAPETTPTSSSSPGPSSPGASSPGASSPGSSVSPGGAGPGSGPSGGNGVDADALDAGSQGDSGVDPGLAATGTPITGTLTVGVGLLSIGVLIMLAAAGLRRRQGR